MIGATIGGASRSIGYSSYGEVATSAVAFGGEPLFAETMQRDSLGRIVVRTEMIGGITKSNEYRYDSAGRLLEVKTDGQVAAAYVYHANGARLSRSAGTTETGSYDEQDRLVSYGDYTFTFSQNGELLSKTNAVTGEVTTYTYDGLGNLRRVAVSGGATIDYVISAGGRRSAKKSGGAVVRRWLYGSGLLPVAELDAAGAVTARFVGTEYMVKNGRRYAFVKDHLGSIRLIVDADSGEVAQRLDYDEYGRVLQDTSPGFQPFGFAGGLYDPDTGLVRFGARDYDPLVGRWTNRDPIGFKGGTANLYEYAGGDPINVTDRTGLLLPAVAAFGIGLGIGYVADQIGSAIGDFLWAYSEMRDAGPQWVSRREQQPSDVALDEKEAGGPDKFFHCVANCMAANRGSIGAFTAWTIGATREWADANFKGDSRHDCQADLEANLEGRKGGDCEDRCGWMRPPSYPAPLGSPYFR